MKKLLLAIVLMTSAAQAYLVPGNGDGHHQPHPQPAPYPGHGGGHSHEPNPYHPSPSYPSYPSYPDYSDYGPARTIRWQNMGESKVDKGVAETIRIHVGGRLVNEVLLRSMGADTDVTRARARLSNGRVIHLPTGRINEGRDVRVRLDSYYSVRVQSIELDAISPDLFGSRAKLQIWLGLAD